MRVPVWINSNKSSCVLSFARQKKSLKLHDWHVYGVFSHMIFFHMRFTQICTSNVVQRLTVWFVCLLEDRATLWKMKYFTSQIVSTCSNLQCHQFASVLETRRLFERSEKAEPSDPLSSHPEPHRGICWPVLRHACWIVYKFLFQPCPNRSAWWRLECTVTYLRWLCGQMAEDVTHPDISEASLRLASAAAALPSSSLPTSRPSTAFTLQLWHTGT